MPTGDIPAYCERSLYGCLYLLFPFSGPLHTSLSLSFFQDIELDDWLSEDSEEEEEESDEDEEERERKKSRRGGEEGAASLLGEEEMLSSSWSTLNETSMLLNRDSRGDTRHPGTSSNPSLLVARCQMNAQKRREILERRKARLQKKPMHSQSSEREEGSLRRNPSSSIALKKRMQTSRKEEKERRSDENKPLSLDRQAHVLGASIGTSDRKESQRKKKKNAEKKRKKKQKQRRSSSPRLQIVY